MPRLIALEWGNREVRLAVGDVRRGKLVLEQALEVPLTPGDGESGGETQAAEVLANVVAKYGLAKCETLVAVGRSNVELKQLSIPPAPDEELADLVRLQAQFDFNSLGDDWPIDFLPLSAPAGGAGQRQVLAAAISPETVNQILDVCRRAELRPSHLVLRPCAAASLLCRRRAIGTEGVRLLVDVLRDEADLTVLTGQQALVLRTARLPSDVGPEAEEMRPLVGEIRRTIVAAQNLLGGEKVGQVELCGSGPGYAALAQWLAAELNLSVDVFDPLEGIELAPRLAGAPPTNIGRFAPLVGLLVDEAEGAAHSIDFLNPRRSAEPPRRSRAYLLAGVALAAIIAAVALWVRFELVSLDAEAVVLAEQSKATDAAVKQVRELEAKVQAIDDWKANEIVWLDELRELATEIPAADEAMLTLLRCSLVREGGEMRLEGAVRDAAGVDRLEAALRDKRHRVAGQRRRQDPSSTQYTWKFDSALMVTPGAKENYRPPPAKRDKSPAVTKLDSKSKVGKER